MSMAVLRAAPHGQGPPVRGKPLGDSLGGSGKSRRFADAKGGAGDEELHRVSARGVGHGRGDPEDHRQQKSQPGADAVEQRAGQELREGVADGERRAEVAVLDLADVESLLKIGRENAEDGPIEVADGRGEKQKPADDPRVDVAAGAGLGMRGLARGRRRTHVDWHGG
jgi:hypothetical protein